MGCQSLEKGWSTMGVLWQEWSRGWRGSDVHLTPWTVLWSSPAVGLHSIACTGNVKGTKRERGLCAGVHTWWIRLRRGFVPERTGVHRARGTVMREQKPRSWDRAGPPAVWSLMDLTSMYRSLSICLGLPGQWRHRVNKAKSLPSFFYLSLISSSAFVLRASL